MCLSLFQALLDGNSLGDVINVEKIRLTTVPFEMVGGDGGQVTS